MKNAKTEILAWLIAAIWVTAAVWPATFWYNPGHMRIVDVEKGQPIELKYDGGVVRSFLGSYSVVLRDIHTSQVVGEMGSARFNYSDEAQRPYPLFLDWWAPNSEQISYPDRGDYVLYTCWSVHGRFFGLVPSKTTCTESNIFSVF